jgi:primosomal protein N' (replication factor Y)
MPYVDKLYRDRGRDLRRHQTKAERALWTLLHNPQLARWRFRRQHPIPPYIVDFACPRARLIVEADGIQHAPDNSHDRKRDAFLVRQGWHLLRFWNDEILGSPDHVLERIRLSLDPHPNPPPLREGGSKDAGDLP